MWLEVKSKKSKSVLLAIVYRVPHATLDWFDMFGSELSLARSSDSHIIVMGILI